MNKTRAQLVKSIAVLSASFCLCSTGFGSIVFDNSVGSVENYFSPGNNIEFGDQVFLAGEERRVTDFEFDYFLSEGTGTAQIQFYENDNGLSGTAPGTLLFQSVEFSLSPGHQSVLLQGLSVMVPNTFTWTVILQGIAAPAEGGLVLAGTPVIGASLDDYWQKTGTVWETFLIDNGATPANFAARISAVPEPSTYALVLLGGLTWAGYLGYKRRSAKR